MTGDKDGRSNFVPRLPYVPREKEGTKVVKVDVERRVFEVL